MVSDGLNGNAITDPGPGDVVLPLLRTALAKEGWKVAPETIVCKSGRVRAGYRAGEVLFGSLGGTLGMFCFHHKTRHWYFRYGFPILLVVQLLLLGAGAYLLLR